jgi:Flp pilus assembly protein TadB
VVNERLRIGDADRETATHELGEHFALGRITAEEHSERLEQIWSARTAADLAPAFRDLPRPQAARPRPAVGRDRQAPVRRGRGWRPDVPHIPFPLKVLIAIVAIWWGLHHLLFLLVGIAVYVVIVRRFVRRRRWDHGPHQAGWR